MFANWARVNEPTSVVHVSEVFFSSNCSKFAVECDWNSGNSQNVQNLGFFKKNRWVFWKKMNFLKIAKGNKFALECLSNAIVQKCLFHLNYEVFLTKNQKILNVGKIRKYYEKKSVFQKKRSHLLKLHLYQIGKSQIMPMVAARLVACWTTVSI